MEFNNNTKWFINLHVDGYLQWKAAAQMEVWDVDNATIFTYKQKSKNLQFLQETNLNKWKIFGSRI